MKLRYFVPLLLFAVGCGNAGKERSVSTDTANRSAKFIKTHTSINDPGSDTLEFPKDTIYQARILTEGSFHNDEVDPKDTELSWMGIFKADSSYYISACNIKVLKTRDIVLDEETGPKQAGP